MASHGGGVRADLPGLPYEAFFEDFGASLRRKHLVVLPQAPFARLGVAARLLLGRLGTGNRRLYSLPSTSRLPLEFIRLDPWEAEYLYQLAQAAERGIVEIGRFHGGSTFLLSCANREIPIWSIDVAPRDDRGLERLLAENGTGDNVELLVGSSHDQSFPEIGSYDLLFIDGDHTRNGCLADLEAFVPELEPGGHLALHDCYAEFQVQQAVLEYTSDAPLTPIAGPYAPRSHWHTPTGSIAHFVKRD